MDIEKFAKENGISINEAYRRLNEGAEPKESAKTDAAGGEEVGKKRGHTKKSS